jgi:hypothetical protein
MNNAAIFKSIKFRNLEVPCAVIAVRALSSSCGVVSGWPFLPEAARFSPMVAP